MKITPAKHIVSGAGIAVEPVPDLFLSELEVKIMFCPNCGKKIIESTSFCEECGFPLSGEPENLNTDSKVTPNGSVNTSKKRHIHSKFIIITLAGVILALLAYIGAKQGKQENRENPGSDLGSAVSADVGAPYSQYSGTWATSDIGWVYGGQILDITVNGDSISVEYSEIQSAPASRVASISKTIPISEIRDNVVITSFEDDGWGHSGTMSLTFTADAIICEIKDVQEPVDQFPQWGVLEGKFLLVCNDTAHEAMEYEPGEYEKMFPDSDSGTQPAESNWIEGIPYLPGYADLFYFEDWGVRAHERPHDFEAGGVEDFIGLSNSPQVSYSTSDIDGGTVCFGVGPEWTVSYAEVADEPLNRIGSYYQIIYEQEPLIGKRDDGYCFLFYKRDYDNAGIESYCYEIYMVQQTDSPDYKDWLFKAYIYVNAPEFYDYLNGTKELEIISVPVQGVQ